MCERPKDEGQYVKGNGVSGSLCERAASEAVCGRSGGNASV